MTLSPDVPDLPDVPDFERLYAGDPDPWQVATSWYERRKIAVSAASLRRERYALAWDAACGTGDLAVALAARCERVVATDLSSTACDIARARLIDCPNAEVTTSALPARPEALTAAPDLVVLSEVLYYLDEPARRATYALVDEVSAPDADVLAVHWAPHPEDAYLSGAGVQAELDHELRRAGWGRLVSHVDAEFVLGLWSRDLPDHIGR